MNEWAKYTVSRITKGDKNYPNGLQSLRDSPKIIYYRGKLDLAILSPSIAVVGSRRMTRYGAFVVDKFVPAFVRAGVTTVSGYMYGVDTEVHSRTTEYGGKTIAVMGGGVDAPYPPDNDKLYAQIVENGGVVLSEYKPEAKPKLWMYPQRNRIIAALSTLGVLVVEAGEGSGSLVTVKYARRLKKKIYAVPGPITSSVSGGTNMLIKKGIAELVTEPEDIIRITKGKLKNQSLGGGLSGVEKEIYELLKREEMSIDEIAVSLGKGATEVGAAVSILALNGVIIEASGKYYCG